MLERRMSAPRDIAPSSPHSRSFQLHRVQREGTRALSLFRLGISRYSLSPSFHPVQLVLFFGLFLAPTASSLSGSTVLKTVSFSPNEESPRVLSRSRLLLTRNAIVVRFSFHLHIPFSVFLVSRLFPSNENRRCRPRSCSKPYAIDFSPSLSRIRACLSFVSRSILLFFSAREMQEMETRRWKITITDATATASTIQRPRAVVCLTHARTRARVHASRQRDSNISVGDARVSSLRLALRSH